MSKQEEIFKAALEEMYNSQEVAKSKSKITQPFEEVWEDIKNDKEFGTHLLRAVYSAMDKYHNSFKKTKK